MARLLFTCTLGPADQGGSRSSGAPVPGPGQQDADVVLRVRLQVPDFVGEGAHAVRLRPHGLAGPVLDLPPDDRPVPHDGVGVELDDEICGPGPQELGGRDGRRGHCDRKGTMTVEPDWTSVCLPFERHQSRNQSTPAVVYASLLINIFTARRQQPIIEPITVLVGGGVPL